MIATMPSNAQMVFFAGTSYVTLVYGMKIFLQQEAQEAKELESREETAGFIAAGD